MWAALLSWIPSIVLSVMAALGLGFLSYQAADLAISTVITNVQASMTGFPSTAAQLIGLFGLDKAMSLILSGVATGAAIRAGRAGLSLVRKGGA